MCPSRTLYYRIYGRYNLTTTIRTREISFPQANSAITQMVPEADVAPRTNGDLNLRAVWNGALRYVGSFQIRVQVRCQQTVSVRAVGIVICDPTPGATFMVRRPSRARWSSSFPAIKHPG